jgi:antitoxin HicB
VESARRGRSGDTLQVDRILDPKRDITLSSLQRAAAFVGQRVMIELL